MNDKQEATSAQIASTSLFQSERLNRILTESLKDIVFIIDRDDRVAYVNQVAAAFLGRTAGEILGKPRSLFFPSPDTELQKRALDQVFQSGEGFQSDSYVPSSNMPRWIDTILIPIKDETSRVEAVMGVSRDITDRKRAENALAAEKERLAVTLRSIGDGVIVTNREGRIEFMNSVAEQLTGRRFEESWGRLISEVWQAFTEPGREPCSPPLAVVLETGECINPKCNFWIKSKKGGERLVSMTAAPLKHNGSNISGMVLAFKDITEKTLMEEEVRKSQHLESLGILAGGIAHDFNNLLAGIFGYMDVALETIRDQARTRDYLQKAMGVLQRAKDLTHQLLTFSKGETPERRLISMTELIKDASAFAMAGSNVKLTLSLSDDLSSCELDAGQISEMINNILINAQQAMPSGGSISLVAENVSIEGQHNLPIKTGCYVLVAIRDTGTGIPADCLGRIFDPFFTTKKKGNGLGLTMSYSVVKKHEGCLLVESEINKGTTFKIYLPASMKKASDKKTVTKSPKTGHGNILVMDDEEVLRDVICSMLKTLGYTPVAVSTGTEVVALFADNLSKNTPVACIILDLTVPGEMGGKEAMQQILEQDPNARGIVSSGYSDDPILSDPLKFGFRAVLRKPFTLRDFGNVIHQALS